MTLEGVETCRVSDATRLAWARRWSGGDQLSKASLLLRPTDRPRSCGGNTAIFSARDAEDVREVSCAIRRFGVGSRHPAASGFGVLSSAPVMRASGFVSNRSPVSDIAATKREPISSSSQSSLG